VPTINHFHGQDDVVARFRVALEAAWNDGTRLPHMLLVGPPGTGKTTLAQVAAREVGVQIHERIGQVLNTLEATNGLLMEAGDGEIVFIDEIHELPPQQQTILYRAMDDGTVFVNGFHGKSLSLQVNDFSLLAATTDEHAILKPLRDRFKVVLPFQFYDEESLSWIAIQHARSMGLPLDPSIAQQLAARARSIPRLVLRHLEACHRYARSRGENEITQACFDEAMTLEGVDTLGLGVDEVRYLQLLANSPNQAVRLYTIESMLGIHRQTICRVLEPDILRFNLACRTEQGRMITEEGLRHLGVEQEVDVRVA